MLRYPTSYRIVLTVRTALQSGSGPGGPARGVAAGGGPQRLGQVQHPARHCWWAAPLKGTCLCIVEEANGIIRCSNLVLGSGCAQLFRPAVRLNCVHGTCAWHDISFPASLTPRNGRRTCLITSTPIRHNCHTQSPLLCASPAPGLWTSGSGQVVAPERSALFFLPQQPFMPLGTLRQQLLFPSGTARPPICWVLPPICSVLPPQVLPPTSGAPESRPICAAACWKRTLSVRCPFPGVNTQQLLLSWDRCGGLERLGEGATAWILRVQGAWGYFSDAQSSLQPCTCPAAFL